MSASDHIQQAQWHMQDHYPGLAAIEAELAKAEAFDRIASALHAIASGVRDSGRR